MAVGMKAPVCPRERTTQQRTIERTGYGTEAGQCTDDEPAETPTLILGRVGQRRGA